MKRPWLGIALASIACSQDASPTAPEPPPTPVVCEPGTAAVGGTCIAAGYAECTDAAPCDSPSPKCEPGTAAFYGDASCTSVGPGECPSGFARHESGFGCVPVLPTEACTGATRPRLGDRRCVPVGECSAPAGATYFVDDTFAPAEVDDKHFTTIQAAVLAAPAGATIAVEEGTYDGTVTLTKAVTLRGRCASKVTLRGGGVATPGLEISKNVEVALRGMTVADFELGVSAGGGAKVELDSLVLEANRRIGILAADSDTRVSGRGLLVRGTRPDASGRFGHGAAAGFGGEITLDDSAILDSTGIGAGAQEEGRLKVSRSVVIGVAQRASNKAYGWGIGTQTGGAATVVESAIFDTFTGGVVTVQKNSSLRLERSYIRGVGLGPNASGGLTGACALAELNSSLTIEGSTLAGSDAAGVFVGGGAKVEITGTVVRDLTGKSTESGAISIAATSTASVKKTAIVASTASGLVVGGSLEASDVYVADVVASALGVHGKAKLERFSVEGTRPGTSPEGNEFAAGIFVDGGGSLEATDIVLRKTRGMGLLASRSKTKAIVRRALIADTTSGGDASGFGVAITGGAELTLEDMVIARARDIAVHASDSGSVATLRSVALVDTRPNGPEERGRTVNAQDGARVSLARVLVRGGKQVGIDAVGGNVHVEDSVVAGVGTTKRGFGHGVAVTLGGSLTMTHSVVRDHAGIGFVFADASGSVASSVVRGNPVGVHTQEGVELIEAESAPTELAPLSVVFTSDTRFEENGTKVGSGNVPLPAQVEAPAGHR